LVMCVLIVAIWVVIEVKRLKHKIFAILLIGLIIFAYVSFAMVFKDQEVNFKTIPGLFDASKIYFSWLLSITGNMHSITTHAIQMDWQGNETSEA